MKLILESVKIKATGLLEQALYQMWIKCLQLLCKLQVYTQKKHTSRFDSISEYDQTLNLQVSLLLNVTAARPLLLFGQKDECSISCKTMTNFL